RTLRCKASPPSPPAMSLRRSAFFIRFLALGALAHVYVGARLIPDAGLPAAGVAAAIVALCASCVLIPLGMASHASGRQPWGDRLAAVGLAAMGHFSSLFVLTVLRDAALLLAWLAALATLPVPMDALRAVSAPAVPLLALAATLLGLANARRRARVVTVDVPIDALPAALQGYTIVQISDLHVGPTIKRRYLQAVVDAVNAAGPD